MCGNHHAFIQNHSLYRDFNGDGEVDEPDRFGFVYSKDQIQGDALAGGANIVFTAYDESDGYYYRVLENERTADFLAKIKALMHENKNVRFITAEEHEFNVDLMYKLKDDTVLFMPHMLSGTDQLRDMTSDYGIVPMPKMDEAQKDYAAFVQNGFTVFAIPTTCRSAETVAPFLEAMCAESYRTVTPAYYDVALKVKYAGDDDASEMYDIIRASNVFDFGRIFNDNLSSATYSLFRQALVDGNKNWVSTYEKNAKNLAKQLEKVVNNLTKEE